MIKKLILLGLGLTLLIGLPLTIYILQNQTQPKSNAASSTTFSFDGPTQVNNGQNFDEAIDVDPQGQNQVSFVKVTFTYDGNFLDESGDPTIPSQYTQLEKPNQPSCDDNKLCQISFTLSVGQDTSSIIKTKTGVATFHFLAKANTDPQNPTELNFVSGQNQALSVASGDQPAENVYQSGVPLSITIGTSDSNGGSGGGATDTPTPTSGDTGGGGGINLTVTPTGSDNGSGGTGTQTGNGSTVVSCTSLTADQTSGNPPLNVTFTAVGSSSNDTISQLAINYGDGLVDTIASGSGIGTGNVNAQTTHSYSNNGTFTATATFTTNGGATSNPTSCSQTITIGTGAKGNLPPTGPGQTLVLVGIAGALLSVVGAAIVAGL